MIWLRANSDMIEGYQDGFDLKNPEPSDNRSHSYRHGFANGRADKTGISRGLSTADLNDFADTAMARDEFARTA